MQTTFARTFGFSLPLDNLILQNNLEGTFKTEVGFKLNKILNKMAVRYLDSSNSKQNLIADARIIIPLCEFIKCSQIPEKFFENMLDTR